MNEKLESIFKYYKSETSMGQSELVISMLTELQEASGYLSDEVQTRAAETAGVNTGYIAAVIRRLPHLHAEPFRHEIRVCISDRCKAKGGNDVLKKLEKLLKVKPGHVTRDGVFLLNTEYCMHNCMNGPNIKIDGAMFQNVSTEEIQSLLQKYRINSVPHT